jgi:hypothetical protein
LIPLLPNNINMRITSIRKGTGIEGYWRVGEKYKKIIQDTKPIRWGQAEGVYTSIVYYIYDHEDNLVVEVEPCSSLTITYGRE